MVLPLDESSDEDACHKQIKGFVGFVMFSYQKYTEMIACQIPEGGNFRVSDGKMVRFCLFQPFSPEEKIMLMGRAVMEGCALPTGKRPTLRICVSPSPGVLPSRHQQNQMAKRSRNLWRRLGGWPSPNSEMLRGILHSVG